MSARFPHGLLRALLWLHPQAFRQRKGREVAELYGRMWDDLPRRDGVRAVAFRVRIAVDLLWNAAVLWGRRVVGSRGRGPRRARTRDVPGLGRTALAEVAVAVRRLLRTPGFTLVAILTLSLGISVNVLVFGLIDGVYLKPLPYREPDRLVYLQESDDRMDLATSFEAFRYFEEHSTSFQTLGAYAPIMTTMQDGDDLTRVSGAMVSANLFPLLGARPLLGRAFLPGEDDQGAESVIILSHAMWVTRFGGRPDVVGTRMGGSTVVGVMPADFHFPAEDTQFWITLMSATRGQPTSRYLTMVGRLAPGVTLAQAGEEAMRVGRQLEIENDPAKGGEFTRVFPLKNRLVDPGFKRTFAALAVAVGFLLLIAMANLTNLLLVRASTRRSEIAIRKALGASSTRLTVMGIAEPVILSLVSGAVGVVGAYWGMRLVPRLAPTAIPRQADIGLSLWVVLFALALSLAAGLVIGGTSFLGSRSDRLTHGMGSGARVSKGRRLQSGFTVAQVALTCALLAGVSLMVKTVMHLQAVNLGFRTEHAVAVNLTFNADPVSRLASYDRVAERLRALPGIEAAGYVTYLPLTGSWSDTPVRIEGSSVPEEEDPVFEYDLVSPGFFKAMGIGLRQGRLIDERDTKGGLRVALVNQAAARLYFPDGAAVGRRLAPHSATEREWLTVVGVVEDVRQHDIREAATPKFYVPFAQSEPWRYGLRLVVRTDGLPFPQAESAIRGAIRDVVTGAALVEITPLGARVERLLQGPRFNALLLGVFTVSALALAALGLYGVLAFGVAERHREIGIRLALGADARRILGNTLGRGLTLTLVGIVLGVPLALGMGRVLASMLFGVRSFDPGGMILVVGLLVGVSTVACLVPSFRASRVDPVTSLRLE